MSPEIYPTGAPAPAKSAGGAEIYTTPSGIAVERTHTKGPYQRGLDRLLRKLDSQRGIYLSSGYEFPGRYSRWDIAALAPPLELSARDREVVFTPLNSRGEILNRILEPVLAAHPHWESFANHNGTLRGLLKPLPALFPEEQRSKQPSVFSIVRALIADFRHPLAAQLSLTGAFVSISCSASIPSISSSPAPMPTISACFSATTSTSWIAKRNHRPLPVRFRPRRGFHARPQAHRRARQASQEAPVRAHHLRSRA